MQTFQGIGAYRGFTLGPAFLWTGWDSAEKLFLQGEPVILIAEYIETRMIENLEQSRVRGFVVERGSLLDPVWDKLAEVHKPSLVGAAGIAEAMTPGEMVILDSVMGIAALQPTPAIRKRASDLRGTKPPHEASAVRDTLTALLSPIRQAWRNAGRHLPFDLPAAEQQQLYRIAARLVEGFEPSDDDDALVERLLFKDPTAARE